MKTSKVTIRNNNLRYHLSPVLENWIEVICDFTNNYDNSDALYWYNERANVGALASALTLSDSYVLEEYSCPKSYHGEKWQGRSDIFFVCGNQGYVAEAKQCWVSISRRSKPFYEKVNNLLKEAREQAVSSEEKECRKLGVVFIVPYIPKTETDNKNELISHFQSSLSKFDYGAMAYAFPEKGEVINTTGYLYPGVACLFRQTKRINAL